MIKYTLYLGTVSKDKDFSEDIELAILNDELSFSKLDGYTLYGAAGYYEGIKEKCYVLTHFSSNPNSEKIIEEICEKYKKKFNQESVLVVKEQVESIKFI